MGSARVVTAGRPDRLPRDFWKFWFGQTISQVGSWITFFALPLLVFKLTGSAFSLGITMAAEFLPQLLFGLWIGAVMDRVDRKRAMIAVDIARAGVVAVIPILDAAGALTVWWIYAVGFATSTLTIFFDSGQFAAMPSLVRPDQLVTANSRLQASMSAGQVLGPMMAGALVEFTAISSVIYFDAMTFLVSACALLMIPKKFNEDMTAEKPTSTLRQDVREGFLYVWRHPVLRNISMMMALVNFALAPTAAELVLFAKDRLDASDGQVALLYSASGIGIAAISFLASPLRQRFSFSAVILTTLVLDGAFLVLFARTTVFSVALAMWALSSGFGLLFNINTMSLRQMIVPNRMLGRVVSIAGVLAWSAIPLGALLGGVVIEATDDVALVYTVIATVVILLPVAFSRTALGHADRYVEELGGAEGEPTPMPARSG